MDLPLYQSLPTLPVVIAVVQYLNLDATYNFPSFKQADTEDTTKVYGRYVATDYQMSGAQLVFVYTIQ